MKQHGKWKSGFRYDSEILFSFEKNGTKKFSTLWVLVRKLETFEIFTGVYILAIFPPWKGGKKRGTFWSLGKKIGPLRKKIQNNFFLIFIENLF
jgi:hypothetical protein